MSQDAKPVALVDLANQLNFNSSSIKKAVLNRGFSPIKLKDKPNARLYLSAEDAKQFVERVEGERDHLLPILQTDAITDSGVSAVYAIHAPSYDNDVCRLKIGWSTNLQARMQTYRCLVPDLNILAIWVTQYAWLENVALLWAAHHGKQVSAEVFEFDDVNGAVEELNRVFFELGVAQQSVTLDVYT